MIFAVLWNSLRFSIIMFCTSGSLDYLPKYTLFYFQKIERSLDFSLRDAFGHNVDLTKVVSNPTELFGGSE